MIAPTIRVATLNCRNTADRWPERRGLLIDQLAELQPDVIGLQELRHFPSQAGWIAGQAGWRTRKPHWLAATYKTGLFWFWEGIAILTRLPILERQMLRLAGDHRVAGFARVRLPDGGVLDFYNTHLGGPGDVKRGQAQAVLEWMGARPGAPQVLVGDFNATPGSATIELLSPPLRSAYASVHGAEPARTVPTPLRRSADPSRGLVLDYIFVNDALQVHDAAVAFDRAAEDDPGLYPSDHFGLVATVSRRR